MCINIDKEFLVFFLVRVISLIVFCKFLIRGTAICLLGEREKDLNFKAECSFSPVARVLWLADLIQR